MAKRAGCTVQDLASTDDEYKMGILEIMGMYISKMMGNAWARSCERKQTCCCVFRKDTSNISLQIFEGLMVVETRWYD